MTNRLFVRDWVMKLDDDLRTTVYNFPDFVFSDLYQNLYSHSKTYPLLQYAFYLCKRDGGKTPGLDGQTYDDIVKQGADGFIHEIAEELRKGTYKPLPNLRINIPKGNGDYRPLSLPAVRDRIVQKAIAIMLKAIFDSQFLRCSYAYRVKRSQLDAIQAIIHNIEEFGLTTVYNADLVKFFDNLNRAITLQNLERNVQDSRLNPLIRKYLDNSAVDGTKTIKSSKGVPQGSGISPLLSNLGMHSFDCYFYDNGLDRKYNAELIRYADDFLIMSKYGSGELINQLTEYLNILGLELNEKKSRLIDLRTGEPLYYLGYMFRLAKVSPLELIVQPPSKKIERLKNNMERISIKFAGDPVLKQRLYKQISGFEAYHTLCNKPEIFEDLYKFADNLLE